MKQFLTSMLLTGELKDQIILTKLDEIESNIHKLNVLINKDQETYAHKIINYLSFHSELFNSIKLQKKSYSAIRQIALSKNKQSSDLNNYVLNFNTYKVQPVLSEIMLIYSENFNAY